MKRENRAIGTVLGFVMLLVVGCASTTPRQSFGVAQEAFNQVAITLVHNADAFSDEEWYGTIMPLLADGDAALDLYDDLTQAGGSGEPAASDLRAVLERLRPFLLRLEERMEE